MPYKWSETDSPQTLTLWPHRSLPPKGFAWFIGLTAGFFMLPLSAVLGTAILWGLLPFMAVTLWLTWALIQRSYKDGALTETLTIHADRMALLRQNPRSPDQSWEANPYWVKLELHETGGPVENYVTLRGSDRVVEIGAFLSPDERVALHRDLQDRLRRLDANAH